MTLELRGVVKRVGAETHIHETTLELRADGFNILLGTTLAVVLSVILATLAARVPPASSWSTTGTGRAVRCRSAAPAARWRCCGDRRGARPPPGTSCA